MEYCFEKDLRRPAAERILVLDGAIGTMLQRAELTEDEFRGEEFADHPVNLKGLYDILVLTQPKAVKAVHTAFLEAGADLIGTDTFNANRISLARYDLSDCVSRINIAAAGIAREAVDHHKRLTDLSARVAGKIGPTAISLSQYPADDNSSSLHTHTHPDLTYGTRKEATEALQHAIYEQASALIEGGVDLLLFETIYDSLSAQAALSGIEEAMNATGLRIPLMVSVTLNQEGKLFSGETIEEFHYIIRDFEPFSIGINCGLGPYGLERQLRMLKKSSALVSFHPNAGLPDEYGNYNIGPEEMTSVIGQYLTKGLVDLVGGCCGVTPEHILSISEHIRKMSKLTSS